MMVGYEEHRGGHEGHGDIHEEYGLTHKTSEQNIGEKGSIQEQLSSPKQNIITYPSKRLYH